MSDTPLAVLRRAMRQGTPLAPVHAVLGVRLRELDPGRCVAALTAPADPDGADALLAPLVLADFALGVAVNATVGAGERIATLSLSLQRVASVADLAPGSTLVAVGRLDDVGDGTLTSSAEITDGAGRLLVRARARNAVLRDALAAVYADTPDAFADDAPWSVADLLATTTDATGVLARPHPCTANSADAVQGGVLAAVAARALTGVLGRVPDEVTATFPRAVAADGRAVRATATAEHAGRRLRTARAELGEDGGDRVAVHASALSYAAGGAVTPG